MSTDPLRSTVTKSAARPGNRAREDKAAVARHNGVAQTVAARGGTATNAAGSWTTRTADISAWAGQTIQLRVEALDANPGSLIEAGVDNVTVVRH